MSSKASNARRPKAPSTFVKTYLIAYNFLSGVGWGYLLLSVLVHIFNLDGQSDAYTIPDTAASRLSSNSPFVSAFLQRAQTTYLRIGAQTAFVQSFALLEVVHVMLGWVRSSLPTTASQVASRLFLVWGVTVPFVQTRSYPTYATMVFAWSLAEVIRYSFYTLSLSGFEAYPLVWLRYTAFYVLYPLGASSEASLIYFSLPNLSAWNLLDSIRGCLFVIWWPGLYVLYNYMRRQRRKVLASGAKPKEN